MALSPAVGPYIAISMSRIESNKLDFVATVAHEVLHKLGVGFDADKIMDKLGIRGASTKISRKFRRACLGKKTKWR